jgi:methylated-DNA-[protein]-cysteine S-methyltransferase
MTARYYALFDTPVGRCAIAWGEGGIAAVQLPERNEAAARARLAKRFPGVTESAPTGAIQVAIDDIVAMLQGKPADLSRIGLDMERISPFYRRVYEAAREIAPGTTLSYGELAQKIGSPGAARAVGQALGRNPFPIVVPCHRVLAAGGKVGGFSADGGIVTKLRLLRLERVHAADHQDQFEGDGAYGYDTQAAVTHLRKSDPQLARVIDAVGPFRMQLKRAPSVFGALAESIVYQQLSGRAAATIFSRVCALFPNPHEGLDPKLLLKLSDEKLLGAGLSRAKLAALRDLAQKAVQGIVPSLADVQRMEDDAVIEALTQVRGIGRWTVEMLLIFRLARPDVLPLDDLGIRKGFGVAMRKRTLPSKEALEKRGERWRPYRSVASWYLWRATELPPGS